MKCDVCGISMYAMTPHYMDVNDNNLYCENCYKKKGSITLMVIEPEEEKLRQNNFRDYKKRMGVIKLQQKLLREKEEELNKKLSDGLMIGQKIRHHAIDGDLVIKKKNNSGQMLLAEDKSGYIFDVFIYDISEIF